MSLNWDLSEIENHEELFVTHEDGERYLDGLTNGFIWATMATGLDKGWKLTEEFAPEFYARLKALEKWVGPMVTKNGQDYFVTFADVQRRIGLQTNAGSKTRAQFIKDLVARDMDADVRKYKAEIEKVAA